MNPTTLILIGAAVYFLILQPAQRRIETTGSIIPPATARTTAEATRVTVPGVGTYENIYGGGTAITVNPNLFTGLFGGGGDEPVTQPEFAYAPLPAPPVYTPTVDPIADSEWWTAGESWYPTQV